MVGCKIDSFGGHAVCTTEVAAFGDAYAEGIVETGVRVCEEGSEGSGVREKKFALGGGYGFVDCGGGCLHSSFWRENRGRVRLRGEGTYNTS